MRANFFLLRFLRKIKLWYTVAFFAACRIYQAFAFRQYLLPLSEYSSEDYRFFKRFIKNVRVVREAVKFFYEVLKCHFYYSGIVVLAVSYCRDIICGVQVKHNIKRGKFIPYALHTFCRRYFYRVFEKIPKARRIELSVRKTGLLPYPFIKFERICVRKSFSEQFSQICTFFF